MKKKEYRPPFKVTSLILKLSENIYREIGRIEGAKMISPSVKLRRTNKIKTIQASLAIEGNTLTVEQITYLLEGKRVIGPKKDILEVRNALLLYDQIHQMNPLSINDLLEAHKILMNKLMENPGKFRITNVGIFKYDQVTHIAPPHYNVLGLMDELFSFIKNTNDISWLLKSCIFHYEFEFIHPFVDGNGRIGRLWQQLLLMKESPVFGFIPVEEIVKENQEAYYSVLGECDSDGESTKFIELLLEIILISIQKYTKNSAIIPNDARSRLEYALSKLSTNLFSRKDYLLIHPDISQSTASRDLLYGLRNEVLTSVGEHNQIKYQAKI